MSLLDLAKRIVDRAEGNEGIEAFVTHEREFTVKTYEGRVENLSSAEPRGAGIRVMSDGHVGFAYTTDLTDEGLSAAVGQARANARHSTPDDAVGLADAWSEEPQPVEGLLDEDQPSRSAEEKIDLALTLEAATRKIDPRIRTVEEALYSDSDTELAIATSNGIAGSYRRTDAWCYSVAIAEENGDTQIGFEFDLARGLGQLDPGWVARAAADAALGILGASKIPSRRMPVVFEPYVAGQFLGVIGAALTGEAVQKGRSLFAEKLESEVAAAKLSLIDDGRRTGAAGASPWDAEGTPTQRTPVISEGVLKSYLYDVTSARREGRSSTGNASRAGFKSGPGPSPSNMYVEPTGESRAELLHAAGSAFLVSDFHGVHSGTNAVSGDFSVGATGHLLENGEKGRPVREVTIALPMLDILRGITAVADDLRWLPFGGSYGGATTLVAEMTVAGE
jgi:PmbA protein